MDPNAVRRTKTELATDLNLRLMLVDVAGIERATPCLQRRERKSI
jgi:hypothetical protein